MRNTPASERFYAKCSEPDENGCILWTARTYSTGYGAFVVEGKRQTVAHRFAYQQAKGPIPEGLEIDHLCSVRNCVNPDHLEAVTRQENVRRASLRKTNCIHGHSYTEENTYRDRNGYRECRTCRRRRAVENHRVGSAV